jgi:ankyrin repeat protein
MFIDAWARRGAIAVFAAFLACAAPSALRAQALFERFNMAVAADRADEVTALLARGMDPNTVDPNGDPALLVAARSGFEPTLDALLRAGAKVNARNRVGDNAVMAAAIGGYLGIVRKLVVRGADINAPGWTPLMYAATGGRDEVVRYLLEAGAKVDGEGPNGITALMMAIRGGHAETASLLVAKGADVNHRNVDGASPLAWAKRGGFDGIERELRGRGDSSVEIEFDKMAAARAPSSGGGLLPAAVSACADGIKSGSAPTRRRAPSKRFCQ